MKGLGLQGPLAVVVLPDPAAIEDRPPGWTRMGKAIGLHVLINQDDTLASLSEDHSVRWATTYPTDLVMVVEVHQ